MSTTKEQLLELRQRITELEQVELTAALRRWQAKVDAHSDNKGTATDTAIDTDATPYVLQILAPTGKNPQLLPSEEEAAHLTTVRMSADEGGLWDYGVYKQNPPFSKMYTRANTDYDHLAPDAADAHTLARAGVLFRIQKYIIEDTFHSMAAAINAATVEGNAARSIMYNAFASITGMRHTPCDFTYSTHGYEKCQVEAEDTSHECKATSIVKKRGLFDDLEDACEAMLRSAKRINAMAMS
jgi:hypothetical protein